MTKKKIALADIILSNDDIRLRERSQETVNTYAENLSLLPPIDVNQDNRILDGIHRYLAHQKAGSNEIEAVVYEYESEAECIEHGIKANAAHGVPLTAAEIKHNCIRLCEQGRSNKEIAKVVRRHETVVGKYTKATVERIKNELADHVGTLYDIRDDDGKRIYTHKKLKEEIGPGTPHISDLLDRYYANQIKSAVGIQELTDEDLIKKLDISEQQLARIMDKWGDEILPTPPPEPEPETETEDEFEDEAEFEDEFEDTFDDESVDVNDQDETGGEHESPAPTPIVPRAPKPQKPKLNGANIQRTVSTEDVGGEEEDEWNWDDDDDDDDEDVGFENELRHCTSFIGECTRIESSEIPAEPRKVTAIGADEDGLLWFYTGDEIADFESAEGFTHVYVVA